jgi:hypothetical protein
LAILRTLAIPALTYVRFPNVRARPPSAVLSLARQQTALIWINRRAAEFADELNMSASHGYQI